MQSLLVFQHQHLRSPHPTLKNRGHCWLWPQSWAMWRIDPTLLRDATPVTAFLSFLNSVAILYPSRPTTTPIPILHNLLAQFRATHFHLMSNNDTLGKVSSSHDATAKVLAGRHVARDAVYCVVFPVRRPMSQLYSRSRMSRSLKYHRSSSSSSSCCTRHWRGSTLLARDSVSAQDVYVYVSSCVWN